MYLRLVGSSIHVSCVMSWSGTLTVDIPYDFNIGASMSGIFGATCVCWCPSILVGNCPVSVLNMFICASVSFRTSSRTFFVFLRFQNDILYSSNPFCVICCASVRGVPSDRFR